MDIYLAVHKMSPSRDEQSNFSDCSAALSASAHSKHGYKILKMVLHKNEF